MHEAEALTADADILADAEAHRDALAAAYETLEGAAEDAVGRAVGELAGRAPSAIAERLHVLQAEIAEAAADVRMALESVVIDPERLAGVQARRALLQELTRKYGPGLAEVLESEPRSRRGSRSSRPTTPGRPPWTRRRRPRSPVLGGPPWT